MSGASKLRLWGKIYGKQRDYLICETVMPPTKEKPSDPTLEVRGTGCNEYVYWVTDSVLLDWVQLPEVSPEQIKIAKLIKHVFTGNLFADVDTNPPFPGKERHYLRAQIARITHASLLVPKGMLEFDDEANELKYAEEWALPSTEELKSLESWGHLPNVILKSGRTSHYIPPGLDEEAADEIKTKLEEQDPLVEERMRSI